MGSRIRVPSTVNTRPAALENHTDHFNALRAASLGFVACKYLNEISQCHPVLELYPDVPSCREDADM